MSKKVKENLKNMKNCFKYKIRKGKKRELQTFDDVEIAIYQLSLDTLLLKDFLIKRGIDHDRQSFTDLGKALGKLYVSINEHRYDCFRYDNDISMVNQDEY